MTTPATLLTTILDRAAERGWEQAELAHHAAIRPETLSRAKKRGTMDLSSLQSLASAVELELALLPSPLPKVATEAAVAPTPKSPLAHPTFGLAWSNPDASAAALVTAAIRNGNYHLLLEAVAAHGLAFVQQQFDEVAPVLRPQAQQDVQRKLQNIHKGFQLAEA